MRLLRSVSVLSALAGSWLAAGNVLASPECVDGPGPALASPECVDKTLEKEVVLQPPTPADMCRLDSSQCAPADPIPAPVQVSPPSVPQILLPQPPLVRDSRRGVRLPWEEEARAASGVTRELLRPPR